MRSTAKRFSLIFALLLTGLMCLFSPVYAEEEALTADEWVQKADDMSNEKFATWTDVAESMAVVLNGAYDVYDSGDLEGGRTVVNAAYYKFYEKLGYEKTVMTAISGARVTEVEWQFKESRKNMINGSDKATVKDNIDTLIEFLLDDAATLDGTTRGSAEGSDSADTSSSSGSAGSAADFATALLVIVREGLEAILVVVGIIAYLTKIRRRDGIKMVYVGCLLGIAASIIAAVIIGKFLGGADISQEIIEGIAALVAVVVLFWVSNWMLGKTEAAAWENYIEGMVEVSATKGNMWGLAFAAFLAVFREGAETILFYQPLLTGDGDHSSVWTGLVCGVLILACVYVLIVKFSVRLPLGPFFKVTTVFMMVLCISFLGGGLHSLLVEGGIGDTLPNARITWLEPFCNNFDTLSTVLGIYPFTITFVPQVILTVICVATWFVARRRLARDSYFEGERLRAESEAAAKAVSAEDFINRTSGLTALQKARIYDAVASARMSAGEITEGWEKIAPADRAQILKTVRSFDEQNEKAAQKQKRLDEKFAPQREAYEADRKRHEEKAAAKAAKRQAAVDNARNDADKK